MHVALRAATLAAILLAASAAQSAQTTESDACLAGEDASDSFDAPTPIDLPVASCLGALPATDPRDVYGFHAQAGQTVHAFLDDVDGPTRADVCLLPPEGDAPAGCATQRWGDRGHQLHQRVDASGFWRLAVLAHGHDAQYRLTASLQMEAQEGEILFGLGFARGVARDPLAPTPVDSVLLDLGAPSDGRQTARLVFEGNVYIKEDLDLVFFDADGARLEAPACVTRTTIAERCAIPAGAERVRVEAHSGADVKFTFEHYR